jgi:hypothetical protein
LSRRARSLAAAAFVAAASIGCGSSPEPVPGGPELSEARSPRKTGEAPPPLREQLKQADVEPYTPPPPASSLAAPAAPAPVSTHTPAAAPPLGVNALDRGWRVNPDERRAP